MTVIAIKRGEIVTFNDQPHWVYQSCGLAGVGYYCDTHREPLVHRQALLDHVKDGAEHRVAIYCPKHGFEAPPPKEQDAAA